MARRTIKVKNHSDVNEEYIAAAAVTPGMLLEVTSAGKVQAHSTSEGNASALFAVEDELQGGDIDTAYAADARVFCWVPNPGDIVNAILVDGENVAIGDLLASNGDGKLKKHVADEISAGEDISPEPIVGVAVQAVNLSDSSGGDSSGDLGYDKRIQVRIK
jgi:hypothetical protein